VLYGTVLQDYSQGERRELAMVLEKFTAALDAYMQTPRS
jgi:hypothetical protein